MFCNTEWYKVCFRVQPEMYPVYPESHTNYFIFMVLCVIFYP